MTDLTPDALPVNEPVDRTRWLLSGIIAILGGYLTLLSIGGQLVQQLAGFGAPAAEYTVLLVGQAIVALGVTALGYFLAPGPLGRRLLAKVIFVVAAIVVVASLAIRISGVFGSFGGIPLAISIANPYFMVLAFGGLAWLVAVAARPLAYLVLLLSFGVLPLGYLFSLNGVSSAISAIVQLVACAIVAVLILAASRPRRVEEVAFVEMEEPAV